MHIFLFSSYFTMLKYVRGHWTRWTYPLNVWNGCKSPSPIKLIICVIFFLTTTQIITTDLRICRRGHWKLVHAIKRGEIFFSNSRAPLPLSKKIKNYDNQPQFDIWVANAFVDARPCCFFLGWVLQFLRNPHDRTSVRRTADVGVPPNSRVGPDVCGQAHGPICVTR